MKSLLHILLLCMASSLSAQQFNPDFIFTDRGGNLRLKSEGASHFASLALHCMQTEYPNKLSHVMMDASQVKSPKDLHPAFYGCFDWHSSVHGHWMLIRLLRLYPSMPEAAVIRAKLNQNLTKANLLQEAAYLYQDGRKSFERTYGWAWLLKLAEELHRWEGDKDAARWLANLQPVTEALRDRYIDFLPKQTYPIRTGQHPNTAFGISFAWDYAVEVGDQALQDLLEIRATEYFQNDEDCPASWEPGGADFLSPCLEEAQLMSRIIPENKYSDWLEKFLPKLSNQQPKSIFEAATVTDRSDGKLVHLDGLNLSRAWCLKQISSKLSPADPRRGILKKSATLHLSASLPNIASGDYAGEHWLASFAVYALTFGL